MKKSNDLKLQVIGILSEIRPEYDFSQDVNFIEEGFGDQALETRVAVDFCQI